MSKMNNKKTTWKLTALVGAVSLAIGGGIGAVISVATTAPEVKTVTETVEVEREVTPGSCVEAIALGEELIEETEAAPVRWVADGRAYDSLRRSDPELLAFALDAAAAENWRVVRTLLPGHEPPQHDVDASDRCSTGMEPTRDIDI